MRHHALVSFFAVASVGLCANACSLLGAYANSASSMMTQPGATAGISPAASPAAAPTASETTDAEKPAQEPKAPSTVSVSLHNDCPETVKLFFGDKPKYGSGRYSSLGSNTRTNHTFQPGDQLWIVDDSQNGIESVTVEAGTRGIDVLSSCDGFRTR